MTTNPDNKNNTPSDNTHVPTAENTPSPSPDITSKPYARFLESVLPDMVMYDPVSIGIVYILPDGSIGTAYYNCDCTDLVLMSNAISKDELMNWIALNGGEIVDALGEGGDEEDEDDEWDDTQDIPPDSPPDSPPDTPYPPNMGVVS